MALDSGGKKRTADSSFDSCYSSLQGYLIREMEIKSFFPGKKVILIQQALTVCFLLYISEVKIFKSEVFLNTYFGKFQKHSYYVYLYSPPFFQDRQYEEDCTVYSSKPSRSISFHHKFSGTQLVSFYKEKIVLLLEQKSLMCSQFQSI